MEAVFGWMARGRCLEGRLVSRYRPSQHSNNTNEFLQAPYLGNRPVLYALRALSSLRKTN
jgi:hypothetical protein